MPISSLSAVAKGVTFTEDRMSVQLQDGRELSVPLVWFPRLLNASQQEREQWRLIGTGEGLHWEALDEDISVPRLLGLPCD
ncbi:MAG TPA: DUF2442 domain-containing protein [Ktedonobacterales bacterium]|jgi:hypothetical protein